MNRPSKENIALFLILLGALSRIIPHPPNFTPILSIALFSGHIFSNQRKALAISILGLILSNFILGFESISWIVTAIIVGITALGFRLKTQPLSPSQWFSFSLISSLIFFLLSNFFVWIQGDLYPRTQDGLSLCYVMALPFLKNTVLSTLLYSLGLFEGSRFARWTVKHHHPMRPQPCMRPKKIGPSKITKDCPWEDSPLRTEEYRKSTVEGIE